MSDDNIGETKSFPRPIPHERCSNPEFLTPETLLDIIDQMPIGVYIADSKGKIIYGNKAGASIWQGLHFIEPNEYSEYKAWRLNSAKPLASDEWALHRALAHGETTIEELLEIEAFDGLHKFIQNSAAPLYNDRNEQTGGYALNRDVTGEYLKQKQIEILSQFPACNPNPVLQVDVDAKVRYFNNGSRAHLPELDLREGIILPEPFYEYIKRCHTQAAPLNAEISIGKKCFSFTFAPVEGASWVNIYGLDISGLKNIEGNLRQKTLALEAAYKELSTFSYSVCHDLRSPITNIKGYCELLNGIIVGNSASEAHEYLQKIDKNTTRLVEIIEDILTLSLATNEPLKIEPVELHKLAHDILRALRHSDPMRNVSCSIAPVMVGGDIRFIKIALENLIGNAWKYTGDNDTAQIEVGAVEINGQQVCFVRDNGCGFPEEMKNSIFEPFIRAHNSTSFKGTGIGLSIVKRIIERHGGAVWAESDQRGGAVFYFSLSKPTLSL